MEALFIIIILFISSGTASSAGYTQPSSCQTKCGAMDIPYPFGIGDGCYATSYPGNFSINCTSNSIAYLPNGDLELIDISAGGSLRVNASAGYDCYDQPGHAWSFPGVILASPFTFSHTRNKFDVIGCDTLAYVTGEQGVNYAGGCMSLCDSLDGMKDDQDGSCSGFGCCEVSIPRGLKRYSTEMRSFTNYSRTSAFNRCGYLLLAEADAYRFRVSDLSSDWLKSLTWPLVLDWSMENMTCGEAQRSSSYACNERSNCVESNNGKGYLCNCMEGYEGNPYLSGGCKDIDECIQIPGVCQNATCINNDGGYSCNCTKGYEFVKDIGCKRINGCDNDSCSRDISLGLKLGLGIGGGLLGLLALGALSCWGFQRRSLKDQKRKMTELKKKMFEQNGGPFLEQEICAQRGNAFRIFTEEELDRATNGFDDENIIGRGGHGVVYLGKMEDNTAVAIKKSKIMDEREIKEFAREMAILSQINHVNVVKILGCCVEVEVPMLVYEFVPGGTLYELIHGKKGLKHISFWVRLKIAQEVAEALAYLHSYASPPILHKDIKTCNVLLDENNKAKISDFGASSVAPIDENEMATLVQGTFGYLDPEYLQSYQFTEKSDVYSFGVVLVELLTRRKPFQMQGPEDQKGLATTFTSLLDQGKLENILDPQILEEVDVETLREMCELAARCLCMKRTDRPTMREVSTALQILGSTHEHPWVPQHTPIQGKTLLDCHDPMACDISDVSTSYLDTNYHPIQDIEAGR